MGLLAWNRRLEQNRLDKVVARVSAHVPVQQPGFRIDEPTRPPACRACGRPIGVTEEDVRRHQIVVAWKLGQQGIGFVA